MKRSIVTLSLMLVIAVAAMAQSATMKPKAANGCCGACCGDDCGKTCCQSGCTGDCCTGK